MKTSHFVSFCLLIVSGLISFHALFKESLNPVDQLKGRVEILKKERESAELRAQLAQHELADYQQHVATLLPDAIKGRSPESAYPLRQLASVLGESGEMIAIERASGLFERAKTAFRERRFEDAAKLFQRLIEKHPASVHVAESYFLLAESCYQLKDFEGAIEQIEQMVSLFPENELTGFALLRLGVIYEAQDRLEDAGDIYRAVLANFKQDALVKQADASLKAVAL
jgi:TolA-binding protein